jgi:predicted DNA-binding transcriptional regulator AlpA
MPIEQTRPTPRLLRFRDVQQLTGLSRATVSRLEKSNRFPAHVRIADNVIAWDQTAILAWVQAQIDGGDAAPTETEHSFTAIPRRAADPGRADGR